MSTSIAALETTTVVVVYLVPYAYIHVPKRYAALFGISGCDRVARRFDGCASGP